MGGSIFLTLFLGLFLAIGLGILGWGARSYHLTKQAEHWPIVPGTVISSELEVNTGDDSTTYNAKVRYAYSAMGREITGERIAFGYTGSSNRGFHVEVHEALPAGAQVAVRYDPQKPERAALSYGVNQSIMFMFLFGGVWTIFTLGMAAMFWLGGQGAGSLLDNMLIYNRG